MKFLTTVVVILALVATASAFDLGAQRPIKQSTQQVAPPADPEVQRQGGDTIANPTYVTSLPFYDVGTTAGYADDYVETCVYVPSYAPDVVYAITLAADSRIDIDLCGSSYDTIIWVYDGDLQMIQCNDDYYNDEECGYYTSKMQDFPVEAGITYYLIVDGYGSAAGEYELAITPFPVHEVDCPVGAELEGEPPLTEFYEDAFNGGCNSPEFGTPFGVITQGVFCGVAGHFGTSRDTDWFEIVIPAAGVFEVLGDADESTYMFELGPMNCDEVAVVQSVAIGPDGTGTLAIPGEPGSTVWFWVGSVFFGEGEVVEYDYVLYTNLIVATERHTFSEVKALFE